MLAHVGLPLSHVAQIRAAVRQKLQQEEGLAMDQATPLKVSRGCYDWRADV